ncbi:MAG: UPF0175 family protein [Acidobacteria bacterium]|nr:UPF0175 family protein [Acidobacteriota bacterium]
MAQEEASMSSIVVTFPETATVPEELRNDPERTRYLIVGSLYQQGHISRRQAAELAGDAEVVFAAKMKQYGFQPLGELDSEASVARGTRWQALAERLAGEGFLDGLSDDAEELLGQVRLAL